PELAGHQMVISEAVVRGKHYWRVSAAGFGRSSAAAACGRIKSGSQGCLAYAEGSPLPGAVANGTRLAQR
ncbi:MAG TPA: SPOR domain-containing protein, partial [Croceibacterium sp.]|nr:SPOR domain-containing protein [Croceibacterium sp.]